MLGGLAIGLILGYILRTILEDWPSEVEYLNAELGESYRIIEDLEYQLWRNGC